MIRWIALLAICSAAAIGQENAKQFEVASIKPSDPAWTSRGVRGLPNGDFSASGASLHDLIRYAWEVRDFQMTGGPEWIHTARFEVQAKAPGGATRRDWGPMLQALLKERFQLVVRLETREMPIYALKLARKDGKLGPGMTATKCQNYDAEHPAPELKPGEEPPLNCGDMSARRGRLIVSGADASIVGHYFSGLLERDVIDQTGLTGKYDIKFEWTPDAVASPDNPGPSLFTAIQEQLGLKFEPSKGPLKMLIVEHAEKPTEN